MAGATWRTGAGTASPQPRKPSSLPPSGPDRDLLAYIVRHGMVSPAQLAARHGVTGAAGLGPLREAGLVAVDAVLVGRPPVVRATPRGARTSGCDLRPVSLDLARVAHSLALVDLSEELLAAHPGSSWTTERELRRDRMREARRRGRWDPQRRVPDGLLRLPGGRRIAIELDLTPKRSARLDLLAGAYAVDPDADAVWWYLPSARAVARMRGLVEERGLEGFIDPRHGPAPRSAAPFRNARRPCDDHAPCPARVRDPSSRAPLRQPPSPIRRPPSGLASTP